MEQKDLYVAELVFNLSRFVEDETIPQPYIAASALPKECYLSQNIIGDYNACTALYGSEEVLCDFARAYSKFDIDGYDDLTREILADFLNLHNGLFAVNLSDAQKIECTLLPPNTTPGTQPELKSHTYIMPVEFTFGTVNFVLSE